MHPSNNCLFKICSVGDVEVGKTCLIRRFVDNTFSTEYTPSGGMNFAIRSVNIDGKQIILQLWDVTGQDRCQTMIESPFSRLDAVIFVYDVTSHQSFERVLDYWHPRIHHYPGQIRILVGNKVDCASNSGREVSRQSGQDLADTLGILFFETSAILNIGVDDVFTTMARALKKDRVERDRRDRVASAVTLNNTVSNPLRLGCWR